MRARTLQWLRPTLTHGSHFVIVIAVLLAAACSWSDRAANSAVDGTRTSAHDLAFDSAGSLTLRSGDGAHIAEVTRALLSDSAIYIVDESQRQLFAFDRAGQLKFSTAYRNPNLPVHTLMGVSESKGKVFLADLRHRTPIQVLSLEGIVEASISMQSVGSDIVDLAVFDRGLAVATIVRGKELVTGEGRVLVLMTREGTPVAQVCEPEGAYRESSGRHGLLHYFRGFGVSVHGDMIHCHQPVSPRVQRFGLDGTERGVLDRVPPFYRSPRDRSGSLDQLTIERFRAGWTEHIRFFPRIQGFVSIYQSFDTLARRPIYHVFECDSLVQVTACGSATLDQKPLAFLAPDTLVVMASTDAFTPLGLRFMRLRRKP